MIGIFIGIAAVVSLIALGQGLENVILSQFNLAGTDIITIQASGLTASGPPGSGVTYPLDKKQLDKIDQVNGVDVTIGRIIEAGKLEYNDVVGFGFAASMPDGEQRRAVEQILNMEAEKGRMLEDGDDKLVVMGYNFLSEGLERAFGKKFDVGSKIYIQDEQFTIVGFIDKKGNFLFDNSIFMNEQPLRDLMDVEDDVYDIIVAKVKDTSEMDKIKADIERVLRKERDVDVGEEDFTVVTAENAIDNLKSTLFAVQLFVYIIASISIVVGGIGITNTMYTAVLERTKEIGIMKSIGATNQSIFTLFALESGFLGMVGGAIGVLIGIGIASALAALGRAALGAGLITVHFSPFVLIGALLFSFIIGTAAGLLPALQAAKTHPVDALRYTK
jgi:putative ABC transport system permease protein